MSLGKRCFSCALEDRNISKDIKALKAYQSGFSKLVSFNPYCHWITVVRYLTKIKYGTVCCFNPYYRWITVVSPSGSSRTCSLKLSFNPYCRWITVVSDIGENALPIDMLFQSLLSLDYCSKYHLRPS